MSLLSSIATDEKAAAFFGGAPGAVPAEAYERRLEARDGDPEPERTRKETRFGIIHLSH